MQVNNNNINNLEYYNPVVGFSDALGILERLVQATLAEFQLHSQQARDTFEHSLNELANSGLQGVHELNSASIAMRNSLESWELFLQNWRVNYQRLLEGMRNCPAFQQILDRLQE